MLDQFPHDHQTVGNYSNVTSQVSAKKALDEVKRKVKYDKKITWMKLIEKDLKDLKRFVQKEGRFGGSRTK